MHFEIRLVPETGCLHVVVEGLLDMEFSERILADLRAALVRHPRTPVLVDTRGADTVLTATDVYAIGAAVQEMGLGGEAPLALVNRPRPDFDRGSFLQTLSQNRGLQIRQFYDLAEAIAWLRSPPSTREAS